MRFVDHKKNFQLIFLLSSFLLAQEIDQDLKDIISDNPELLTEFNVDRRIQENELQGKDGDLLIHSELINENVTINHSSKVSFILV